MISGIRTTIDSGTQYAVSALPHANEKEPHAFPAYDKFNHGNNPRESYPSIQTFDLAFCPLPQRPEQDPGEQTTLPQPYRQQGANYLPPTPIGHHQHPQYDGSYAYTPGLPESISIIPKKAPKRKPQRASQACDSCRRMKSKCDQGVPCSACKDRKTECVYRVVPVKPFNEIAEKLEQRFGDIEELLRSLGSPNKPPNVAVSGVKSEPSEQAAHIQFLTFGHTARTSLLLNWPSIKKLGVDLLEAEGVFSIDELLIRMERQPNIGAENLEFGRDEVELYARSFKENILNMHPIIGPNDLDSMVEAFLEARSGAATTQPVTLPVTADNHHAASREPGLPQRSIDEAVVLLVLALGKICLHSHTTPDAIPGLQYFVLATRIMGSQVGGCDLEHVHGQILAGLYCGQIGRVVDSSFYISWASRTIQILLASQVAPYISSDTTNLLTLIRARSRLYKTKNPTSCKDNLLALAFWTCLQLENDILAELPLPPSGISKYEDTMPYPNGEIMTKQGVADRVVKSYFAQLFLQKQLNNIYIHLYTQNRSKNNYLIVKRFVDNIQKGLKAKKGTWVPTYYHWNDEDPPTGDILATRLRAKYWDSQVILYRPILENILHHGQLQTEDERDDAGLAIQALIESTRAFCSFNGNRRLVITNILETAHSRWGNLLVLTACYKDQLLRKYVGEDILKDLFEKTVCFFQTTDHLFNSNALEKERNVLIGLAKNLGFDLSNV
ncbi:hypothetical protein F5Y10DRAFT_281884 [Nemania abortiva]|nr:hypothetical protein F5Y10DRAFT_281884 [Nemania abortiva]